MKRTARIATSVVGLCAAVAMVTSAATAAAGKHPATAHRATRTVAGKRLGPVAPLPNALPPKYTVVSSGSLTAAAGTQTRGAATCPAKTVPYGGGAEVTSFSMTTNLNSPFPTSTGWDADINNAGSATDTFIVFAVCAKKNASYSVVVTSPVTNTTQQRATAVCPAGTKVMGGGGLSNSGSTAVNMNSTFPQKVGSGQAATYQWVTDENNATATATTFEAYAVCGHAAGYKLVAGTPVVNPAGMQTGAIATCPSPKVPLGGGGLSSSGNVAVSLNTSQPASSTWEAFEDNNGTGAPTLTAYAICAGT